MDMLGVWFEGKEGNEKTEYITSVAFNDGDFCRNDAEVLSMALKEANLGKTIKQIKRGKIFRSIFVPYKIMCDQYHFLKKLPILLPVMWVFHIFKRLFTKGKLKKYYENMETIKSNDVELYKKSLNFVGLDYNFGQETREQNGDK